MTAVLDREEIDSMENIWKIVSKPDNVPIVGMLFAMAFLTVLAFVMAVRNDLRKRAGKETVEETYARKGKVHVWPYLVRIELISALVVSILLIVWSILLDAPLEEAANPTITPNPAKAPWYFLGLQEMLVYFDPWIAGVVLPVLIAGGLMVMPYIDPCVGAVGYYTFRERRLSISIFCFGFFLWTVLIIIGTFMRGPGWMWFWPWETWDAHRVVAETNIDFSDAVFGVRSTSTAGMVIGFLAIAGYYGLTMIAPYLIGRRTCPEFLSKLGLVRYVAVGFLFWTMMALCIKMVLRLVFGIKYAWVTPWFNI